LVTGFGLVKSGFYPCASVVKNQLRRKAQTQFSYLPERGYLIPSLPLQMEEGKGEEVPHTTSEFSPAPSQPAPLRPTETRFFSGDRRGSERQGKSGFYPCPSVSIRG
jgi:hypothetical protein